MSKKLLVILSVIVILSALLSACGGGDVISDAQAKIESVQSACSGDLVGIISECVQTVDYVLPNDNQ